ncbi:threonylcarbamoyl-AMP synthase, partial [Candidatus Uhrbacteria bacterium]|nr:threonylcarbamoyl-AMP synthase [Candidatus Uhrbacteria bacterium]MBD3284034.1 threonylcarbamoyl-AMP synthase [Candidatus Uhrbacteria bacterium]
MLILRVMPNQTTEAVAIRAAVSCLNEGKVLSFPTETVYGIGADPRVATAVNRMFTIKGRDEGKPIQLIAASWSQVEALAELSVEEKRFLKRFWPGPLTVLLTLKKGVCLASRVSPNRMIGIRITPDPFLQRLIKRFGHPIAATSANRSGFVPATSGRGVARAFSVEPKPDLLLDFGARPKRKPTTVARIL